jgi:hypothetical protein
VFGGSIGYSILNISIVYFFLWCFREIETAENLERLERLEMEQEQLNSSLFALTTHFAQVQFRLKQIVSAEPSVKEVSSLFLVTFILPKYACCCWVCKMYSNHVKSSQILVGWYHACLAFQELIDAFEELSISRVHANANFVIKSVQPSCNQLRFSCCLIFVCCQSPLLSYKNMHVENYY